MKKLILSLIISLPFLMFVSCTADSDYLEPDTALVVDNTVEISGVTLLNGTIYTVEGNTVTIDGMSIKTVSAQTATLEYATLFLGDKIIASKNRAASPSFTAKETGSYKFNIAASLRRSDNSPIGMSFTIPMVIVKNASDLPGNAPVIGTYSTTVRARK